MADTDSISAGFSELNQEQFSQLSAALDRSLSEGPEQQAALLCELERSDPTVAQALRRLLGARRGAEGFLETRDFLAGSLEESSPEHLLPPTGLVGRDLGPYRVVSPLGQGGMPKKDASDNHTNAQIVRCSTLRVSGFVSRFR